MMNNLKSQTEYSYQDHDNFVFKNNKKQQQNSRKSNHIKSRSSSSEVESEENNRSSCDSRDIEDENRSTKRSKYSKIKKILQNTKSSLDKTKNMLEIQKLKNENQEEKLKSLAMEVENLKRHSFENMLVRKSMQSIAFNNGMMNQANSIDNIVYIPQRNNMVIMINYFYSVTIKI